MIPIICVSRYRGKTMASMTLGKYLADSFTTVQYLEFFLRILIASLIGMFIGYERSKRFKGVGVYTHILVCCAAALIMILSKYGFADLTNSVGETFRGTRGADPSRIAAQAISGISFLCAGVIFKQGSNIKGLTTAAGIWVTLALGLSIGAGMYVVTAAEVFVLVLMKILFKVFKLGYNAYYTYQMNFTVSDDKAFNELLESQVKKWGTYRLSSRSYTWNPDGTVTFEVTVHGKNEITFSEFSSFIKSSSLIKSASCVPFE